MLQTAHYEHLINRRFIQFSQIAIGILFIFSILRLYHENFAIAFVDAMGALLIFGNLKSNFTLPTKRVIILSIDTILFTFFTYYGFLDNTLWFWGYTFPAFAYLLNDRKHGKIWSFIFGFILIGVFLLQEIFSLQTGHTLYEFFIFLSVYTLISVLIHLFQKEVDLYIGKLQELNNSLNTLVKEEVAKNKQKDELLYTQAKQAQMGEMLSMIAHHWRQPLNAISASVIKMQLENDEKVLSSDSINDTAIFIQKQTQDLSEIINNFLDLSKVDKKDSSFELSSVIDKVLKMLVAELEFENIVVEVIYDTHYKEKSIQGAEHLYEQVLLNLLMNTKDAFDEKQEIEFKSIVIYVDSLNNVHVKDNAGGISSSLANKIFNPYFTTKEEGKGVGLGLYMSRKTMRTYFNGDLIYTPNDSGSCFKIVVQKGY